MTIDIDAIRQRLADWRDRQEQCYGLPGSEAERAAIEAAMDCGNDVPALLAKVDELRMFERAYWDIQKVLDKAIGGGIEDGEGKGIVADVQLVVEQRDATQKQRDQLLAKVDELTAENLRLREQVFAQKPVIEAAEAWAEMCEDGGLAPEDCRKSEDALHDAVEQYRLMDLALTSARDEAD